MVWPVVLAIVAGLLAVYYFCFHELSMYKNTGVPYLKPVPIFGNMMPIVLQKMSVAELIQNFYNYNPDAKYIGVFDMMSPAVLVRDPELIKLVAVKSFDNFPNHKPFIEAWQDPLFGNNLLMLRDDKWRDARTMLSPAFTSSKMKNMFKLMNECAINFANFMVQLSEEERVRNVKDSFTKYTNDVIATCSFGISVDSLRDPNNEFYVNGRDGTNFTGLRSLKMLLMRSFPRFTNLLGFKILPKTVGDFFMSVVANTIKVRDEQHIHRPDMIQLMMETRGKRPDNELSIIDMTAQAFIFFFAGFDSTSTALSFTAHEIAIKPDVQERLQREIDDILEKNNGEVTYEDIMGMEYLDAVISESLRMYPILASTDRSCKEDIELPPALPGAKPFVLKKGMSVMIPIYALQQDPKYFEDPQTFNPERFLGENKKDINTNVYVPFGIGPRMCIGNRFALLEIKVVFFHLLARCNLKRCEKTQVPIKFTKRGFQMLAEKGFWMKIENRENTVNLVSKDTSQ